MNILGENVLSFEEVIDTCVGVPTRDEIKKNDTAGRSYWKPISHGKFVESLARGIEYHDLEITDSKFALNKTGHMIVGGFKVKGDALPTMPNDLDAEWELFVRHSNNMSHGLQINAGMQLMVCTNGCMSGETIARHKHTTNFDVDSWARDEALVEFLADCANQTKVVDTMRRMTISDGDAAQCILEATNSSLEGGSIIPMARAADIWEEWKNPVFNKDDFEPGTAWKLYGDFTHVAQKCSPHRQHEIVKRANPFVRQFAVNAAAQAVPSLF